ncbi:hypothetical protein HF320_06820 [Collinsella sp. KGMB02528]|uniref:Uncharacterized protein n=1 Tax=Collinsella acetigenes TaxID=2713419 RepID=A0A7X9UCM1_9ACTN|nr:hypothetical protein [Collinsella acetigenes]NMF56036.1 hypothetical protein [Collinsella acetigenes]
MQMNLMDIIGPVALFVGVICIAAALYFVMTLIKGASARRREQRDAASGGAHRRSDSQVGSRSDNGRNRH